MYFSAVDKDACCHGRTTKGLTGQKGGNAGAAGKSGKGGRFQIDYTGVCMNAKIDIQDPLR